ncbi:aldehyde dehydrogenase [Anaerobacillus isosaccharinicus]|uniref:Aldehyde dehydrogenase n=1 Tax=Anaerobacillus isosaccharinicus TaxID=1532552 RepID=A0A1S2LDF4_9BACI|nr:aldehyde dehydrogenase [Anaerobacillus isosaccharinicus]MBA5588155.1 aldehyde dehydrogenase [Anaerobacillus isosaccharinicus]QOY38391.1 aldehyde dehydrogenase [Anaerobacillus isosaccharinicus]
MESYKALVEKQRAFFRTGKTKEVKFRIESLEKLRKAVRDHEEELMKALYVDLHKTEFDAYATEIGFVLHEIRFVLKNLNSWVKPRKVKTPMTHIGSTSMIYPEPYGVSLIIAPWNYPFQLAVAPLIGAIAAGNCSILKPSELTPSTSTLMAKLIKETFPEEYIAVVEGAVATSQALLAEQFDYIFFTGSVPVGKVIMEAAAKNLTPVTLELGGKSPCIVEKTANLKLAAKRIAWGKYLNAGQTCIAPDYLYIQENCKDEFLIFFKEAIKEMFADRETYTRIVSERHFIRLREFLNDGSIYAGGHADQTSLWIEPTVLTNITWNDSVMEEEIFGPILPVLEFEDLDEVIQQIQEKPNPLALYLFSENQEVQEKIINNISFGGGCVNDTIYHITSPYLPFGGVGSSGVGAYHGKGSFDTFSHEKSILKQTTKFDIPFRYPNVKNGLKKIKMFLK